MCLVYLITGYIATTVLYIYPVDYKCSNKGCVSKDPEEFCTKFCAIVGLILRLTLQMFILGLIISVLLERRKYASYLETASLVVQAMRRLIICSLICMLSDIAMLAVYYTLTLRYASKGITNIPYDVTLINLLRHAEVN